MYDQNFKNGVEGTIKTRKNGAVINTGNDEHNNSSTQNLEILLSVSISQQSLIKLK
jgi:hypothetical protein